MIIYCPGCGQPDGNHLSMCPAIGAAAPVVEPETLAAEEQTEHNLGQAV